jgi:RES domain-containing protein
MASPPDPILRAYRIVSPKYPPFDGSGTWRWGSRWVSPGRLVVHAAETYSLAVLENLVHWQTSALPPNLVCVTVQIPGDVVQSRVERDKIRGWGRADYAATRTLGDAWYAAGQTAVLVVPSLVSPYESNVLFNQRHEDFPRINAGKRAGR